MRPTPEATFQHLFVTAMAKCTNPAVAIHAELAVELGTGVKIPGVVDFYLDGNLRWAVELLVHGRGVGEHLNRFGPHGPYSKLQPNDYVVVDLRVGDDIQTNRITRHEKRITACFNQDFTTCKLLIGLDEEEEYVQKGHEMILAHRRDYKQAQRT